VYDPTGKEGVASLTASMLTQGAGTRTAQQIAEDIAFVGGTLEADADAEGLDVECEVLRKDFDTGLALFHDVIVAPAFPADEFDRRKQETLGGLASDKDDPGTVADRALLPFLYGASPLAHPSDGTEAAVSKLTRDDVVAFHQRLVTPDNATLAVVGDVEPAATLAAIEAAFKDWKPSGAPTAIPYAPVMHTSGRAVRIVAKPEVTQTQIRFACPGVARNHPDYFPIRVANTILGGGFTSRLVNEIRVVRGLTYGIASSFPMYRNAGAFEVSTFTRNATLRPCVDGVLSVIQTLVEQGPTDAELDKAKRYLTGQYPLGLQAPDELARHLLDIEFYGLDPNFIETYDAKVNAVTLDDCRRALKSYFCTSELRLLVVANPDSAKAALAGLGATDVVPIP
jgi:zinc protease